MSAWKQRAASGERREQGAANGAKRRWRSHRHDEHRAGFAARGGTRPAAASGGGERSSGQRAPSRARGGGCTRATRRSRMREGRGGAQVERSAALLRRLPGLDLLLERRHRGVHRLVEALAHTLHRAVKRCRRGAQRSAEELTREKVERRSSPERKAPSRRWLVPVAVSDAVTKNCGLAGIGAAPSVEGGAEAPGPRASPLVYQLAQHTRRRRRVCPTAPGLSRRRTKMMECLDG